MFIYILLIVICTIDSWQIILFSDDHNRRVDLILNLAYLVLIINIQSELSWQYNVIGLFLMDYIYSYYYFSIIFAIIFIIIEHIVA